MRRILLIVFSLLLLVSFANAITPFELSVTEVQTTILPDESAQYTLSILNNLDTEDSYHLQLDALSWAAQSEPLSDYLSGILVPAKTNHVTTIRLKPLENMEYGTYRLTLSIDSEKSKQKKQVTFDVTLKNPQPPIKEYFAVVSKLVDIPPAIDPRQSIPIKVNLENRNPKNLTNLEIRLKSNLIDATQVTTLGPLEKKVVKFDVFIPKETAPQDDILMVSIAVNGQVLEPIIKEPFAVKEYSEIETKLGIPAKGFLTTQTTNVYTNNGNIKKTYTAESKLGFLDTFFTTSEPNSYKITKQNGEYLAWDLEIPAGESRSVTVKLSYIPLFILLMILCIVTIGYYGLRSPLSLSKDAQVVATKQGGITQLKVILHLKNRSNKSFDNVTITDNIPNIIEFDKNPEAGAISPTKILASNKDGALVKWELGSLERFEERIMTYRVKSKLTIVGGVNLPSAHVKFTRNGKESISKSNRVDVTI